MEISTREVISSLELELGMERKWTCPTSLLMTVLLTSPVTEDFVGKRLKGERGRVVRESRGPRRVG